MLIYISHCYSNILEKTIINGSYQFVFQIRSEKCKILSRKLSREKKQLWMHFMNQSIIIKWAKKIELWMAGPNIPVVWKCCPCDLKYLLIFCNYLCSSFPYSHRLDRVNKRPHLSKLKHMFCLEIHVFTNKTLQ